MALSMPAVETSTKLMAELANARTESDRLFSVLTQDALYQRPIAERHRVVFYIGHLDGFDSIQICREGLGLTSPDPQLDSLFQAGIDPDSSHLPADSPADWPSLEQIRAYVQRCRQHVDRNLEHVPDEVVFTILEHRYMHLETLAYMFHNFEYNVKRVPRTPMPLEANHRLAPANSWIEIPAGEALLGKPQDGTFGWDNEFDENLQYVPAFSIQQYSVTNGEYMKFVEAGASLPHFWKRRGGQIFYRGMFEELPLPLDWPVYVTHKEARAYANSIGKTIPTEAQFHRAAYGTRAGEQRSFPWGESKPDRLRGNFDFHRWDPEPVDATPLGQSAFGVQQLVGNGWQWTSSEFAPFPGFQSRRSYPGYSANFFDGNHYVMKGASARTAACLLRRSFRNWFRPDYPHTYATFRCVEK
jgi:formylglycine-generating enzyme required for sulfatase activity